MGKTKKYNDSQDVINNLDTNGIELATEQERHDLIHACGITQRLQEVLITPAIAVELCRLNHHNRALRHNKMEKMKYDMTHGLWGTCESMIMISPDGNLVNGQTRLNAVHESGIAQTFVVMYGVEPHVEMDTGTSRSPFDVITMYDIGGLGYESIRTKKAVGAIGGMLRRKCRNSMSVTNGDYCRVFEAYKDCMMDIEGALNTYNGDAYTNAALIAAHSCGVSAGDISAFKASYCQRGKGVKPEDAPVNALWDYFHECLLGGGSDSFKDRKFAATQMALDAFINCTPLTRQDYGAVDEKHPLYDYDITWLNATANNGAPDSTKYRL